MAILPPLSRYLAAEAEVEVAAEAAEAAAEAAEVAEVAASDSVEITARTFDAVAELATKSVDHAHMLTRWYTDIR
jgi:hypothetical protein